jgi:hypothetical protein
MNKYVGISLVSVIGIVAIGVVAYSFNSLNEHIRSTGEASAASGFAPKHFVLEAPKNACTPDGPVVHLAWRLQDNATGYVVYRGEVGIPTSTTAVGYTTAANFVDTTADPLHSYTYRAQVMADNHGAAFSTESAPTDVPVCSGTLSYLPLAPISMLASAHVALWHRSKNTSTSKPASSKKTVTTTSTSLPKTTAVAPTPQPPFVFVPPAVVTPPTTTTAPPVVTAAPVSTPTAPAVAPAATVAPQAPTTAPVVVPPVTVPVTAPASTPVVSSGSMQWGVYAGDSNEDVTVVEQMVGKKVDIHEIFLSWDDSFPTWMGKSLCPDRKMLIFWENHNVSLDSIIAGERDAYLKKFSDDTQAYGCPVVMSLFHEMNGNWDNWGGVVGNNTPSKLISAWRHVHDIMPASNMSWMWVINNDSVPNTQANAAGNYWPGDAYVDSIGIDGFNFNDPWRSFASVFDVSVASVQKYNKPIYLSSLGSVAHPDKAAWITEGLGTHIYTYKNVVGWMWFNHNKFDGNWSINSDAASLAAFKAILP